MKHLFSYVLMVGWVAIAVLCSFPFTVNGLIIWVFAFMLILQMGLHIMDNNLLDMANNLIDAQEKCIAEQESLITALK